MKGWLEIRSQKERGFAKVVLESIVNLHLIFHAHFVGDSGWLEVSIFHNKESRRLPIAYRRSTLDGSSLAWRVDTPFDDGPISQNIVIHSIRRFWRPEVEVHWLHEFWLHIDIMNGISPLPLDWNLRLTLRSLSGGHFIPNMTFAALVVTKIRQPLLVSLSAPTPTLAG